MKFWTFCYSHRENNLLPLCAVLMLPIALLINLYYNSISTNQVNEKIYSKETLAKYTGQHQSDIYLAIVGKVYNVTKGKQYYGPGQTYHIFAGRDASIAFLTGVINEDEEMDDILKLTDKELQSINTWQQFYEKQYDFIGILKGRFYDDNENPTEYLKEYEKRLKNMEHQDTIQNQFKIDYPPCNIEWEREKGTRVWCSTRSGGIERDWSGYPRKYFEPNSHNYRCACVNSDRLHLKNIEQYENCDGNSVSCFVKT